MRSAAFSPDWLDSRLATLLPEYPDVSLCVALSGGVDSVALVAALASVRRDKPQRLALRAVHVHHGLHPNADKWSRHCREVARQAGIPFKVLRVNVARPRGASLEAAAREARYGALGKELKPGEALLTAHHQDDQLETVLLQLLRGAGIAGLAAMPQVTPFGAGRLARPLLDRSRTELQAWAKARGLAWVEDDSNEDERLDRNYLRRSVLPLVRSRWPSAAAAVARSARHAAEARHLLDALARADVESAAVGASLSAKRLRILDASRRRNALRFWIARAGFTLPDARRLHEMAGPLLSARDDAHPQVQWNGHVVERHADVLSLRKHEAATQARDGRSSIMWSWREQPGLDLPQFRVVLEIVPDPHGPLDLARLPERLIVRTRQGGETLRPSKKGRTRTLKALMREARLEPAEREALLLIFAGEKLVGVADRWLDASVQADAGCEQRARFRFHRPAVTA